MQHLSTVSGSDFHYVAAGYSAHSTETFMVESCNSVGCVNSTEASATSSWDGKITIDVFLIISMSTDCEVYNYRRLNFHVQTNIYNLMWPFFSFLICCNYDYHNYRHKLRVWYVTIKYLDL